MHDPQRKLHLAVVSICKRLGYGRIGSCSIIDGVILGLEEDLLNSVWSAPGKARPDRTLSHFRRAAPPTLGFKPESHRATPPGAAPGGRRSSRAAPARRGLRTGLPDLPRRHGARAAPAPWSAVDDCRAA